jgi:hypothetical protein
MKIKMKTSNKILFSFLLFAWASILVTLLVSFRYSILRGASYVEKIENRTWEIAGDFSVVSLKDAGFVILEPSSEPSIKYMKVITSHNRDKEYGEPDPFFYEVRNDTLFVEGMRQKPDGSFIIHVDDLKSVILDQVEQVGLRKMGLDSLVVKAKGGFLSMDKDHGVSYLDFEGKNESRLEASGVESLSLSLDQSKAELKLYLGKISGQVVNQSEVTIPTQSGAMNLSKDKTSTIVVEDNY